MIIGIKVVHSVLVSYFMRAPHLHIFTEIRFSFYLFNRYCTLIYCRYKPIVTRRKPIYSVRTVSQHFYNHKNGVDLSKLAYRSLCLKKLSTETDHYIPNSVFFLVITTENNEVSERKWTSWFISRTSCTFFILLGLLLFFDRVVHKSRICFESLKCVNSQYILHSETFVFKIKKKPKLRLYQFRGSRRQTNWLRQ